jgi:predicted amidohydrolase YtcJ
MGMAQSGLIPAQVDRPPRPLLFRSVLLDGRLTDIRAEQGVISAIGADLPIDGAELIDGAGGRALPGLHDHHLHLRAAAAALNSVRCGPPEVEDEAALIAALAAAPGTGWIRGIGYHENVAGALDRHWLDRHSPRRPIRIQHRSGRMWLLNSAACDLLPDAPANGRWLDGDAALRAALPLSPPDMAPLVAQLLGWGVTGVTDATPRNDDGEAGELARLIAPLSLHAMGSEARSVAPLKIHEHDHALPSLAAMVRRYRAAHQAGRNVAVHCVTLAELMLALAAWDEAGSIAGDRIEHGAIIPAHAIARIRDHGLAVVTQPLFPIARAAAYAREVDPRDRADLWRLKSLIDAGITVAAGSDAPFESANPWAAIEAATHRTDGEAISREQAISLYVRDPVRLDRERTLSLGKPADLMLLGPSGSIRAFPAIASRSSSPPK